MLSSDTIKRTTSFLQNNSDLILYGITKYYETAKSTMKEVQNHDNKLCKYKSCSGQEY